MKTISRKFLLNICYASALWSGSQIADASGFVVKHIKVVGAQRVSQGTVLNYLPVRIGESIGAQSTAKIIQSLYDTGFFQSVSLEREGDTLIVKVVERSTIGSINITGNTQIPKDKMNDFLKEMGLIKGRVFQLSVLERLTAELKQAYYARGKYNARIETKVTELTDNRVAISITISEGRVSRIRAIKIIGNHDFPEHELLSQMTLQERGLFTYFTKKDQYNKPGLDASLEAIRSFYLDRGYLKFQIISSQVLLSTDKKDVYINIHIEEGPQYHFSGFSISGKTILPKDRVEQLVLVKKGDVFSRKALTESISEIGKALGDKGYGFPAINAEPRIDEQNKTVFIHFSIEPGRHVYVRRINFHGNTKTADYALRSVITQDEGALLTLHNVKESERQLRILGYLKNVNIKTNPVPGTNNQVDLDVQVEEAPSAEASASLGIGTTGLQFNVSANQHNFMGTGRSLGFAFNASRWGQDYSLNYFNPFYTNTGIGRGVSVYFSKVNPRKLDISSYNSNRYGVDLNYNIRLSDISSVQLGMGYQDLDIRSAGAVPQIMAFIATQGTNYDEIRFSAGWVSNSYNQMPFPTKGFNQAVSGLAALPANSRSLSYYKSGYQAHWFQPLFKGFIFSAMGNVAFGDSFQRGVGLPFFENYFAGGIANPGMVRGYDSFSLGPKDIFGNSLGANFLVNGSLGLILPYPLSRDTFRTSLFVDAGNVYAKGTPVVFTGTLSGPVRYSGGISLDWRSPFGPLSFSLASPLNKQPGDRDQYFQFALSSTF
ncbi:outer membrane protein assembly factor BamA [Legionella sp. W05-934-2]|jgi:outer membrane protein insertion porin family|uniref:outer membrane protein assembly factor BamA n=1 Tax=Legionella sp. W05-934-2 TaxID=1198649 RepID=UPI003462FBD4